MARIITALLYIIFLSLIIVIHTVHGFPNNADLPIGPDPVDTATTPNFFSTKPRSAVVDNPVNTTQPTAPKQTTHYTYCDGGPALGNTTSDASPLISDCLALIDDISNEEWSYKWISCGQHSLVSHKSCVFGIETVPDSICFPWTTLETGNGDIIDWIGDAISRWGPNGTGPVPEAGAGNMNMNGSGGGDTGEWEGKIGSYGFSMCHNTGRWRDDYLAVKWGIYHSPVAAPSPHHLT